MATVIVVTNFSASSRNALEYACLFLHNATSRVLLLNIFSFPASFTNEGLAVAALSETMANDEKRLQREYEWVRENHPHINIDTEIRSGNFFDELTNVAAEEDAKLIIMGATGNYTDLLSWDINVVNSFVDLPIPVLVVPAHVHYNPIQKMAFACNYYRKELQLPLRMIRKLVTFTHAQLFIIHVQSPQETITEAGLRNKEMLQQSLADLSPVYYEPEFSNVIVAIDRFVKGENIDLLLVIPTRHGIWYNIFQRSHTKWLVYLNEITVLSLRKGEFLG